MTNIYNLDSEGMTRAERTEPATGEDVARMFHEAYERLAPDYGYRTREASAKPWDEVPEQNRALMVATVGCVLAELDSARAERTEPGRIVAPWTPEQVEALNAWQQQGSMHPFTCGGGGHTVPVVLFATEQGWRCPRSWCGYTQDWAHDFMAHAERTEPDLDVHVRSLGRVVGTMRLSPERTEPATGEDVEVVALLLWQFDGGSPEDWAVLAPGDRHQQTVAAEMILAALDLPGRERALREENKRLKADDDMLGAEIAKVEAANARIAAERDAANAALADVEHYLSTACYHAERDARPELHDVCGKAQHDRGEDGHPHCKFCPVPCRCGCHRS